MGGPAAAADGAAFESLDGGDDDDGGGGDDGGAADAWAAAAEAALEDGGPVAAPQRGTSDPSFMMSPVPRAAGRGSSVGGGAEAVTQMIALMDVGSEASGGGGGSEYAFFDMARLAKMQAATAAKHWKFRARAAPVPAAAAAATGDAGDGAKKRAVRPLPPRPCAPSVAGVLTGCAASLEEGQGRNRLQGAAAAAVGVRGPAALRRINARPAPQSGRGGGAAAAAAGAR